MNKADLLENLKTSKTLADIYEKAGYTRKPNSRTRAKVREAYNQLGVDLNTLFKSIKPHPTKTCPVCQKSFKPSRGGKGSSTTCSYSCANTYFRSGENNPNYKGTNYRTICFNFHDKKCVVCGENNIVEVHHLDEDKDNNTPENLIPLCPTHHQYWHSKYRHLVENEVLEYISKWQSKFNGGRGR